MPIRNAINWNHGFVAAVEIGRLMMQHSGSQKHPLENENGI
jgi:hypothetical protein